MNWETASILENDHVAMSRGCTDQPFDPDLCRWGNGLSNGTIFLVGDSQAYAFADGVIEAAARLGMNTRAVQFSCFRPRAAVGPRPKPGKARRSFTPKLDLSGLKRSTRILR
jgi:hypothetical protein